MKLKPVVLGQLITQERLAQALDVSPRTIRNWRSQAKAGRYPKIGRPAHDERAHRLALLRVGRKYLPQPGCGSRPIAALLRGQVPTRLVQLYVKRLKACERSRKRTRILRSRCHAQVLATNALWVQDGTQLGRQEAARIEAQVIKDRGSLATVGIATGEPACGREIVNLLGHLKTARGLPLVLGTDNGSAYICNETADYLRQERVIHLRSLPRTPQHNGAAEIGIRELKSCAKLSSALQVEPEAAFEAITAAALSLNHNRPRSSKGLKTAAQLDETLPVSYHFVERDRFYKECSRRMQEAVQETIGSRASRMAEREAIFSTLEMFGLVKRYRGGSQTTTKAEVFS